MSGKVLTAGNYYCKKACLLKLSGIDIIPGNNELSDEDMKLLSKDEDFLYLLENMVIVRSGGDAKPIIAAKKE